MLNYTNPKFSSGIPLNVGDRHYSQDLVKDFRYHQYRMGLLLEKIFGINTGIIEGLEVSQGTGHTINITSGKGIVPFSLIIPDRVAAWAVPPSTESVDIITMPVVESDITDMLIAGATTDGTTTNYVKLSFVETDGNTRTRAKKAGSYSYEIIPSYSISVNSIAPTSYEIVLTTFTTDGATITFLGNGSSKVEINFNTLDSYINVSSNIEMKKNRKYLISENNLELLLPNTNLDVGDTLEIYSKNINGKIIQQDSENIILFGKKYNTTKGTSGFLNLFQYIYIKFIYSGIDYYYSGSQIKISDPATIPADTIRCIDFSFNTNYLAVSAGDSPYIYLYSRSGDTFTKLSDPASLPSDNALTCSFSMDDVYLAVGASASATTRLLFYKRSGDTFTKLSDPASLPTGSCLGCKFSKSTNYLAATDANSPFIFIYKRSGDTFTKLANPSTLPPNTGFTCDFSMDDVYLAVSHANSPFITIYRRSEDTFTKLANPSSLPASNGNGCAFSKDGNYLAVAHDVSPFITIYKRSGDTFTKLANPSTLPAGTGRACDFSPDGRYLAVAHSTTPFITIYYRDGDSFIKISDPGTLPGGNAYVCRFSKDGNYLAIGTTTSQYLTIYKNISSANHSWQIVDIKTEQPAEIMYMFN
jgi:WD40 repeat protein